MTKQEFINIAHKGQNDAGTQIRFNESFTEIESAISHFSRKNIDPVSAFLVCVFRLEGEQVGSTIESLEFYKKELDRAISALTQKH